MVNGVMFYCCWYYVLEKLLMVKWLIYELSFVVILMWWVLWMEKLDVYVVVSLLLFFGIGVFVVSWLKCWLFVFYV